MAEINTCVLRWQVSLLNNGEKLTLFRHWNHIEAVPYILRYPLFRNNFTYILADQNHCNSKCIYANIGPQIGGGNADKFSSSVWYSFLPIFHYICVSKCIRECVSECIRETISAISYQRESGRVTLSDRAYRTEHIRGNISECIWVLLSTEATLIAWQRAC